MGMGKNTRNIIKMKKNDSCKNKKKKKNQKNQKLKIKIHFLMNIIHFTIHLNHPIK